MTRINLIPVEELTDQHLLSEHREIKRIPNVIKSWRYSMKRIPDAYTLGKWHVKFFYDKMLFLWIRYQDLYKECKIRWFSIEYYWRSFLNMPIQLFNSYTPTPEAVQISRDRINERINTKPNFYRYKWKIIN